MSKIARAQQFSLVGLLLCSAVILGNPAPADAEDREFASGSLIIPMDQSYQDSGMLQAYGLLTQLLQQGVPVSWVIKADKIWHDANCDALGDNCNWDCDIEGSGIKCPYPTATPDFFVASKIVSDDSGTRMAGDLIANHGYRGGPFVIAAADKAAAIAIISEWNDENSDRPWSQRTGFRIVSVHETTAAFTGNVAKSMVVAPSIAVFSDGNEDIATQYLRAAGIRQSNGFEFPANKCGDNDCGPGTGNPDMLTVPSIMGDMGTCDNINYDHKNGSLFTEDGLPAYCQIMSMHWGVGDREKVECDGDKCPDTQAECAGETITYHGHEVVAEVRKFLEYPVHFFAECQAVNAYENTTPNPNWPFLDDAERDGHFLTTLGVPPNCPCTDAAFECVSGGCNGNDCCLPIFKPGISEGAGLLGSDKPDSATIQILHPEVAYNQQDGRFGTTGGSEPSYSLSAYLGTEYQNGRDVTFVTGPLGPGDHDVWMTGYVDGACDIVGDDDVGGGMSGECNTGKVSYLGGHNYKAALPMSQNAETHGARLFLNALFEADCVTSVGQPSMLLDIDGNLVVTTQSVPVSVNISGRFNNQGSGAALNAVFSMSVPAGVSIGTVSMGTASGQQAIWDIGSISGSPALNGTPPSSGQRSANMEFGEFGDYDIDLEMNYRVGINTVDAPKRTMTLRVVLDSDGDNVADVDDSDPNNPNSCSDSDNDSCDDCVSGLFDPANDGPDQDGDSICDAGEQTGTGEKTGGCGCQSTGPSPSVSWLFLMALLAFRSRRRRS